MDGDGVGENEIVELAASIDDIAAVKTHAKLLGLGIDLCHKADIAIIDLLLIVVLDLHDLIFGAEGPSELVEPFGAGRIERLLQFEIE